MSDYLMRFEDGPLAKRQAPDLRNLGGVTGHLIVSDEDDERFEWPLPQRLGVALDGDRVGLFVPLEDVRAEEGSPFVVYEKVGESQLPEDVDAHPHVIRGARYRLET